VRNLGLEGGLGTDRGLLHTQLQSGNVDGVQQPNVARVTTRHSSYHHAPTRADDLITFFELAQLFGPFLLVFNLVDAFQLAFSVRQVVVVGFYLTEELAWPQKTGWVGDADEDAGVLNQDVGLLTQVKEGV